MKLHAPKEYWSLHPKKLALITGGCGPGRLGDIIIPDTVWLLPITEACKIHDYMYHKGKTLEDKAEADRVFLDNMLTLIEEGTSFNFLKCLRQYRAMTYYIAVRDGGEKAFWKGKKKGK